MQAFFNGKCVSCHGPQKAEAGLRLDSWTNLIKGTDFGEAIIPFDSENSVLIEMLTKLRINDVLKVHPTEQGAAAVDSAAIAFLARWIDEGAKNDANEIPYENSTNRIYVCSQDADIVSIIDVDAKVVIGTIDLIKLGFNPGSKPHHVAVAADGQNWFLSMINAGKVLKFNANNEVVAEDTTALPALLAHHPTEDILYISRFVDPQITVNSIYVMDSQSFQPFEDQNISGGKIFLPSPIPHGLSMSHDGQYVYTASLSEDIFFSIEHATKEFKGFLSLNVNSSPLQSAVSPDNNTVFLSGSDSDQMFVIDVSDPTAPGLTATVDVPASPWHLAFTPDGSKVYAAHLDANQFSVIDASSLVVQSFGLGDGSDGLARPHGIAVSPNGDYVFISNRNVNGSYQPRHDFGDNEFVGTVVVINADTNQIEKVLEIEEFGSGMASWSM